MSTPSQNTTLTLDDIQMIGELVEDSENRMNRRWDVRLKETLRTLATKDDLKSLV